MKRVHRKSSNSIWLCRFRSWCLLCVRIKADLEIAKIDAQKFIHIALTKLQNEKAGKNIIRRAAIKRISTNEEKQTINTSGEIKTPRRKILCTSDVWWKNMEFISVYLVWLLLFDMTACSFFVSLKFNVNLIKFATKIKYLMCICIATKNGINLYLSFFVCMCWLAINEWFFFVCFQYLNWFAAVRGIN